MTGREGSVVVAPSCGTALARVFVAGDIIHARKDQDEIGTLARDRRPPGVRELPSGYNASRQDVMTTYTAQVGPENASRLAVTGPDGVALFTELDGGVVQINDLERLRARPRGVDGYLTDDEEGLQIWVGGESYPVFDDFDAAVADALGLQTRYDEAKREFNRAAELLGAAIAKVLSLSESPAAAAAALDLDEATVTSLASRAPKAS
jgi:hypothetical protein